MTKLSTLILGIILISCDVPTQEIEIATERLNSIDWNNRRVDLSQQDSLMSGRSYLSVYSEIYHVSELHIRSLTATVSLRNTNERDTIFISRADYFNTSGTLIRGYINEPIFILPMATIEVIIDQIDKSAGTGGTGGNFVFDWGIKQGTNPPIFEGVMLSIAGTQAFSFVTRGWQISK